MSMDRQLRKDGESILYHHKPAPIGIESQGQPGKKFYRLLESTVWLACEHFITVTGFRLISRLRTCRLLWGSTSTWDRKSLASVIVLRAVKNGTLSVGFIGLAETLVCLGKHHGESNVSQAIGISIVQFMRQLVDQAVEQFNLNYTLIATPAEGLSGRFIGMDLTFRRYSGVTDGQYYTNSFHIPVYYDISLFEKDVQGGPYHKYTNAGHISYVEFPAPPVHNGEAIQAIVNHMSSCDMGYAGINFPIDFCESCGFLGVIDEDKCPECGGDEIKRVRRITGYLSTVDRFNDAKIAELKESRSPTGFLGRDAVKIRVGGFTRESVVDGRESGGLRPGMSPSLSSLS